MKKAQDLRAESTEQPLCTESGERPTARCRGRKNRLKSSRVEELEGLGAKEQQPDLRRGRGAQEKA